MGATGLSSPSHAVVGASDVDRTCRFLSTFGFHISETADLPMVAARDLYGLNCPLKEVVLRADRSSTGWFRVVQTPERRLTPNPGDHKPLLVELYTRNVDDSLAVAADAGAYVLPPTTYSLPGLGPMREGVAVGPDFLCLGLIESESRRPSLLDSDTQALYSEIGSVMWAVGDLDGATAVLTVEAGLSRTLSEAIIDARAIPPLKELLMPSVPTRIACFSSPDLRPLTLELTKFLGASAAYESPAWPLRPGLHAIGFNVDDVPAAVSLLPSMAWGPLVELDTPTHHGAVAATGLLAQAVRLELWQEKRYDGGARPDRGA